MTWRTLLIGCVLSLVAGGVVGYELHGSPAPAPAVKAAVAHSRVETKRADSTVVVERVDSSRTVIALAPLEVALHTVDLHDSASVTRVITAAADVAPACRALVSSCSIALAAKDSVIHAKDQEIAARDAARPSRLRTLATDVIIAGVAYGLGRAGVGAHLSLRVPF